MRKLEFKNENGHNCRCSANTGSICTIFNLDLNTYYEAENRDIEKLLNQPPPEPIEKPKKKVINQPTLF